MNSTSFLRLQLGERTVELILALVPPRRRDARRPRVCESLRSRGHRWSGVKRLWWTVEETKVFLERNIL